MRGVKDAGKCGRLVSRAIVRGLERRRRDQGRGDAAPHGSLRDRPLTRWTLPRRIALGLGVGGLVFFFLLAAVTACKARGALTTAYAFPRSPP
jgi:hypothetical protein